ncbi:MAG: hypothetical protein MKZ98_04930, partial [Pseudomonadales bacterium]|nr:hypothetical protein [Pseudomonadales bacterium]
MSGAFDAGFQEANDQIGANTIGMFTPINSQQIVPLLNFHDVTGQRNKLFRNIIREALRRRRITDPTPLEDPKDPDHCNVFTLYRCFSTEEVQKALAAQYRAGNYGYGHAKVELFDKAREYFA